MHLDLVVLDVEHALGEPLQPRSRNDFVESAVNGLRRPVRPEHLTRARNPLEIEIQRCPLDHASSMPDPVAKTQASKADVYA
jgi:hypothetical protein